MKPKIPIILALLASGLVCLAGTKVVNSHLGFQIGSAATELVGFWGATPVVQPTSANQAALTDSTGGSASNTTLAAVTAPSAITDSTGGSAGTTLAAITTFTPSVAWNGSSVYPSAADATAIAAAITSEKNSLASLAARQAEDRAAIVALTDATAKETKLLNAIRSALVAAGLIKGS